VATISRLLKIIGLFCKILSLLLGSFAKETYDCQEPTNRSHPHKENAVVECVWGGGVRMLLMQQSHVFDDMCVRTQM